jgi:hypothetical protein
MKYYTGIGSRETPKEILKLMVNLGDGLYGQGYTLRSGGAPGADQAFEWGAARHLPANDVAEIYLPWASFCEGQRSKIVAARKEPQDEAYEIAAKYHPRWKYLKFGAKKLHARNVHQIFGYDVNEPEFSSFVVCWTKGGKGGGGTGQALRIAKDYDIPIYDLYEGAHSLITMGIFELND